MKVLKLEETIYISGGVGPEMLSGLAMLPTFVGIGLVAAFSLGAAAVYGVQYFASW